MNEEKVKRLIKMPVELWQWVRRHGNATVYIVRLIREDMERNAAKAAERGE